MTKLLSTYATPLITGLFIISLVSGIALFLHVGPSGFHGMHEWLSMVLILPFALHIWKNWRPMVSYFRRLPMALTLALSALAAAVFLLPTGTAETRTGPPQFQLVHRLLASPLDQLAPSLGLTPEALSAQLTAAGFTVTSATQPLTEIAAASGKSETDLAAALIAGGA